MKTLFVPLLGYKILHAHKRKLESRFKVEIRMPERLKRSNLRAFGESIRVNIIGNKKNFRLLKKFLKQKLRLKNGQENNQSVVLLNSDSEDNFDKEIVSSVDTNRKIFKPGSEKRYFEISESDVASSAVNTKTHVPMCKVTRAKNRFLGQQLDLITDLEKCKNNQSVITLSSDSEDDSVKEVDVSEKRGSQLKRKKCGIETDLMSPIVTSFYLPAVTNTSNASSFNQKLSLMNGQYKQKEQSVVALNRDLDSHSDEVTIISENLEPKRKKSCCGIFESDLLPPAVFLNNPIPVCEATSTMNAEKSLRVEFPLAEEFIPLCFDKQNRVPSKSKPSAEVNKDVVCLDEEDHERPYTIPKAVSTNKELRPIVIDGSNIARKHGEPKNTYSCRGIEICVEFFLRRGHTQVTAFVPNFIKHRKKGPVKITGQKILKKLGKKQLVVFTPSREIDGKMQVSYDDRFVLELAAQTGGVVLSNDNFKDLFGESLAFAETIRNRLLKFCFVRDILLIPKDPLGSKRPTLDEFLSFPSVSNI